jgi:hypothetical protein
MARLRKLGPDAVRPVRGGVDVKRAHHLTSRGESSAADARFEMEHGDVTAPSALPSLYAGWMAELLPGAIPSEPHATCDDCAMTANEERRTPAAETLYYAPSTKCCTLIPNLPSYVVGRVLADQDPHPAAARGRETVRARIRARGAVTPLGLGRTLGFSLHYRHHPERFGQSEALRCPHYIEEGGLCGVWKHRESTCATWFCKYERGVVAVRFWESLRTLLQAVDHELSYWCATKLGLDNAHVRGVYEAGTASLAGSAGTFASHLLEGALGRRFDRHRLGPSGESAHRELWGAWAEREEELYIAAAGLVAELGWSKVAEIAGARIAPMKNAAVDAYRTLRSTALPARLASRSDELGLVQIGRKKVRVDSYRAHDPHELPAELLELLPSFDGKSTMEALAAIERDAHVRLAPELVRKLVDYGLLVDEGAEC